MKPFPHLLLAGAVALSISAATLPVHAADASLATQLSEARQEGAILTSFALNRHLSPFDIDVAVKQGVATLTGTVENDVDKDLAEQLARDTSGIEQVSNQLQVDANTSPEPGARDELAQRFDDATLTATIKSKLLWNSVTNGLNIEVRANAGTVTLKGQAQDPDAREVAGQLATNTEGVTEVNNLISVSARDTAAIKAQNEAATVREQLSDGWVTGKVKSSLLYSRTLDGLSIKVTTREGMVRLDGVVTSYAQKQLAVSIARNVRGVEGVDADGLRVETSTTASN